MELKTKKIVVLLLSLGGWILESLPNSAVLLFANPAGAPFRENCSYFDPIHVGYANFGPFVAAVLTGILLILALAGLFGFGKGLNFAMLLLSGLAAAASLSPVVHGWDRMTLPGVVITLLLLSVFVICLKDALKE